MTPRTRAARQDLWEDVRKAMESARDMGIRTRWAMDRDDRLSEVEFRAKWAFHHANRALDLLAQLADT